MLVSKSLMVLNKVLQWNSQWHCRVCTSFSANTFVGHRSKRISASAGNGRRRSAAEQRLTRSVLKAEQHSEQLRSVLYRCCCQCVSQSSPARSSLDQLKKGLFLQPLTITLTFSFLLNCGCTSLLYVWQSGPTGGSRRLVMLPSDRHWDSTLSHLSPTEVSDHQLHLGSLSLDFTSVFITHSLTVSKGHYMIFIIGICNVVTNCYMRLQWCYFIWCITSRALSVDCRPFLSSRMHVNLRLRLVKKKREATAPYGGQTHRTSRKHM